MAGPRALPAAVDVSRMGRASISIVVSAFHRELSESLLAGAREALVRHGVRPDAVNVRWAPGAWELPMLAAEAASERPRPDAIVALGTLIRGETIQYEVIAQAVAHGLMHVALSAGVPVSFGVIVAETRAQAEARAGRGAGNRGAEAALAALETLRAARRRTARRGRHTTR